MRYACHHYSSLPSTHRPMTTLRALIVDDEPHCRKALIWDLNQYCPHVEIVGQAENGEEALDMIGTQQPDIVFLDIEMPHLNGLQVLAQLSDPIPKVIFTTAYDQFAIQALRMSAVDYLLKPVVVDDLKGAVQKAAALNREETKHHEQLQQSWRERKLEMVCLPVQDGFEFVEIDKIMYCLADSNYTEVVLWEGDKIVVSKTLKEVEALLDFTSFVRVHKSAMIQLHYLKKYIKSDGGYAVMRDGEEIPVSRRKKDLLLERFAKL